MGVRFTFSLFFGDMVKWLIFKQLYFRNYSTDLDGIHITRIVWIYRFWISKADFDYVFPSWSNQPFCKGTIHIIVRFYRNSKILSFSNGCISGVCEPIWWYKSVDFEYIKLNSIIFFHHSVISYFLMVPFTLMCVLTKIAKKWSFLNDCNSGVYGLIWMIFTSKER